MVELTIDLEHTPPPDCESAKGLPNFPSPSGGSSRTGTLRFSVNLSANELGLGLEDG